MTAVPSPFSTDAWRGATSANWLDNADRLEATLEPVLAPLFDHAAIQPGEHVLDVGCGRAATTLRAARAAGPSGAVTAVDVSQDLLDASAALAVPGDGASITWRLGDAQRMEFATGVFDVAISRFGVMFFDDPVVAFTNIGHAVRPGGRLAVATWRPRDQSPFGSAVLDAVNAALEGAGYEVEATDPAAGPYSFGVDEFVQDLLSTAGWRDVAIHPYVLPLLFGGPSASAEQAAALMMGMPGYAAAMERYDDRGRAIAAEAVIETLRRRHDGTGVRLDAALVIICARRP